MTDDKDNVIHVSFKGVGGRIEAPRPAVIEEEEPERKDDPLSDLYSIGEVAKLFDLSVGRLRYWDRTGFLSPSATHGSRRYYNFQDLVGIRAAKGLIERGVKLTEVRRALEALRDSLPRVIRPLSELRVVAEGSRVVIRDRGAKYEPITGQLLIDFEVNGIADDVVKKLRVEPRSRDRASAYEFYLEGCRLDEDEATFDRAEAAYKRALELDPSLANAVTNLGNLAYRRGRSEEARAYYTRALEIDPDQPEALYNLGFLALELGNAERAVELFERAIASDPSFADAHFNLALAHEELGDPRSAKRHWREYLSLEPTGAWAEIARRHLDAAEG
ncbi:MAG: tetratricopeptide repeat protein [Myxococcales bacterium]|nr:tetratricopeptide repeat protein [Myxococcales bacterium]